jgi:hypothetical protein
MTRLSDDEFRTRLRAMLARSGRSMRGLSAAFGRDPGYVAALLDPTRQPRARPTPADLLAASEATGIPLVTWLTELWAIEPERLADELMTAGSLGSADQRLARLSPAQRRLISQLIDALAASAESSTGRQTTLKPARPSLRSGADKA